LLSPVRVSALVIGSIPAGSFEFLFVRSFVPGLVGVGCCAVTSWTKFMGPSLRFFPPLSLTRPSPFGPTLDFLNLRFPPWRRELRDEGLSPCFRFGRREGVSPPTSLISFFVAGVALEVCVPMSEGYFFFYSFPVPAHGEPSIPAF